jgi:two-component system, cell cycle response regulator
MKILLAEDHKTTRKMLSGYLTESGYEVEETDNGEDAWEKFRYGNFRFVITDWVMPKLTGLELIRKIREWETEVHTYVIMLTGKGDREALVEGLTAGADDYIAKPFFKDELAVRVRAGERIVELQQRLEQLAGTDPLTGLSNRRGMRSHVEHRLVVPALKPIAFILADIDHFKKVNDTWGHEVGDVVIKGIAAALQTAFRQTDEISRMGGEEFLVIAPDVNPFHLYQLTDRVRQSVADMVFDVGEGKTMSITASFGVTYAMPGPALDMEECINIADKALYESKNGGRNRVTVIHPDGSGPAEAATDR